MSRIFIKNGKVVTMAGRIHEGGSILLEEGKIQAVGKVHIDENKEGLTVIDAKGNWVMPGLMEAHCQICIS